MARTFRIDHAARVTVRDGAAVTHYYRHEEKPARKATNRAVRHATRAALRNGDEVLPTYVGTCGWITH